MNLSNCRLNRTASPAAWPLVLALLFVAGSAAGGSDDASKSEAAGGGGEMSKEPTTKGSVKGSPVHRLTSFSGAPGLWLDQTLALDFSYGWTHIDQELKFGGFSLDNELGFNSYAARAQGRSGALGLELNMTRSALETTNKVTIDTPALSLALAVRTVLVGLDVGYQKIRSKGEDYSYDAAGLTEKVALGYATVDWGVGVAYVPTTSLKVREKDAEDEEKTTVDKGSSSAGLIGWHRKPAWGLVGELYNDFNDGKEDGEPLQEKLANERWSGRLVATFRLEEKLRAAVGLARNRPGILGSVPYFVQSPTTGCLVGAIISPGSLDLALFLEQQKGGIRRSDADDNNVTNETALEILGASVGVRL